MADRDTRDEEEVDNWFDEPDTSGAWEERSARVARSQQAQSPRGTGVEDWISPSATASIPERLPVRELLRRHRVPLAAALIVVVGTLGGLAAAGVFSGGHESTAPPSPTVTAPTATTTPPVTQAQPALTAPSAPLKPGDHGARVKVLQRALARLGYSPGTIDGQYGPSTTQAVSRFQRANGLTADGILGPNTLHALTRALEAAT
jgi:Putative peptidoglycan binding domain